MKDNNLYLGHMRDSIEKIESFVKGYTYEQFVTDEKTFSAVLRELEIIGEAAKRVHNDFQEHHADIPWMDIISMRNRLIHEYVGIKPEIVWNTCTKDLPELKQLLEKL